MSTIPFSEVKQDCKHFRGSIPCLPNKQNGVVCSACSFYLPISKRILIIKLGALGDVIRTTPLIVAYKTLYPNCHITWLTLSPDVLPANEIDELLTPDAFTLFRLSKSKFDIAINLDKEEEAGLLLSEINAREKYGYIWKDKQLLPATPAAEHKIMTGFFDQVSQANSKSYLSEIFEICHLTFDFEPYLIRKNEELAGIWKAKLQQMANGRLIVGLNTGCGPRWNTRLWPVEYWIALAKQLTQMGFYPVFLGGALEDDKNNAMAAQTGTFYPGHFSLEEFIALSDACDIIVSQVSMMMHIAIALQKKLILMNNIFNPHEFELYGRGEIVGPQNGCVCYFGNTCQKGVSCMHELLPETVWNAVQKWK